MKLMEILLRRLFILQEVSNKGRKVKIGDGYSTAMRFNPYNPLSYIAAFIILIIHLVCYGVIGVWEDFYNPFKWS